MTPRERLRDACSGMLLSLVGLMLMLAIGLDHRDNPNKPQAAPAIKSRKIRDANVLRVPDHNIKSREENMKRRLERERSEQNSQVVL